MLIQFTTSNIHPVTLGAIKRAENQVEYMANTLLKFHCTNKQKNSKIVKELLKERFSHQYLITRREAKDIGLPIGEISSIKSLIMSLYGEYAGFLELGTNFFPEQVLGKSDQETIDVNQAIIEDTVSSWDCTVPKQPTNHPIGGGHLAYTYSANTRIILFKTPASVT